MSLDLVFEKFDVYHVPYPEFKTKEELEAKVVDGVVTKTEMTGGTSGHIYTYDRDGYHHRALIFQGESLYECTVERKYLGRQVEHEFLGGDLDGTIIIGTNGHRQTRLHNNGAIAQYAIEDEQFLQDLYEHINKV